MKHDYKTLAVSCDDRGVVSLELARPDKRNAMSGQMIDELTQFAQSFDTTAGYRAVVLSGQGAVFCAGADLGWMQTQIQSDRSQRMVEARKLADMLYALNTLPAPLIGRVHGGAFGGGLGLCCVCDIVIADQDTKFGLTETRLGLIPATISPYVIARMGEGKARRIFMSARIFSASEAQQLDIIVKTVPAADLGQAVFNEVEPYLHVAPGAVAASKSLARSLGDPITSEILTDTIKRLADTWETDEAAHGIGAFLSKTKPRWA